MTARERKAVAETLRTWAAWCEANPGSLWSNAGAGDRSARADLAYWFADQWCNGDDGPFFHRGPTAATGLLLAAAMVEAGDSL